MAATGADEFESHRRRLGAVAYRMLGSARARREAYFGEWLPEPIVDDSPSPHERAELGEAVSLAMMAVLERLTPAERTAFVLHDVFGVDFPRIAGTFDGGGEVAASSAHPRPSHLRPLTRYARCMRDIQARELQFGRPPGPSIRTG